MSSIQNGTARRRIYPPGQPPNPPQSNPQLQQQAQPGPSNPNPNANPPQQQQNQAQNQNQNQNANGNGTANTDAQSATNSNAAGGGGEMNLAGILHYLQSEWRRWERDRNEWEIERAEMRARIALLEGQRRSAENLKTDLLRRVKMLEFALKQERTKTVGTSGTNWKPSALPPSRLTALQQDDDAKSEKESSTSGSEEGAPDRLRINGSHPPTGNATSSVISRSSDSSTWKHLGGGVPRDPKSRAKSRDFLKQCLQEITYLTSPGALNPLPTRPPIELPEPPEEGEDPPPPAPSADFAPPAVSLNSLNRPIKALPERAIASTFIKQKPVPDAPPPTIPIAPPQSIPETKPEASDPNGETTRPVQVTSETSGLERSDTVVSHDMAVEQTARPPSSPAPKTLGLPDEPEETPNHGGGAEQGEGEEEISLTEDVEEKQLLTAIYRPDSSAAWREELRAANEKAEKARAQQDRSKSAEKSDEEQLASLTFNIPTEEEDIGVSSRDDQSTPVQWTARRSMKSLDVVRAVAFGSLEGGGKETLIVSGGDDCVINVWKVETASISSSRPKKPTNDLEPIQTHRGHTAPITSIITLPSTSTSPAQIISASLDSTIRVWSLPKLDHTLYAPYDAESHLQTLEGHSEAVWDLIQVNEDRFMSASSDGTIKSWARNTGKGRRGGGGGGERGEWKLVESRKADDDLSASGVIPVCLGDGGTEGYILVGLSNGGIMGVDDTGGEDVESVWGIDEIARPIKPLFDSQVNAVVAHADSNWVIAGYEDGHVRIFTLDRASQTPIHDSLAHPSGITSITLSPTNPKQFMTSSTDCTVRVWDMESMDSIQELGGHRKRGDEGVTRVVAGDQASSSGTITGAGMGMGLILTAGGDGVVKVWSGV